MILGHYCNCTACTATWCCRWRTSTTAGTSMNGCVFTIDVGITTTFTVRLRDFQKAFTRAQLAQRNAATRARLMKPPVERVLAPIEVVNAGMQLRRMRASTGLARGRA